MTLEELASIAGILLSLAFSYIPGLSEAFASLSPIYKRLIMLALLLAVTGSVYGLACVGFLSSVTCDQAGGIGLVRTFIAAMIANQGAYSLSPETAAVRHAKAGSR